ARRILDARAAAIVALALAISYLMLFNPRTEGNTYILLAPPLAVLAAWSFRDRVPARNVVLLALCLLLGGAHLLVPSQRDHWIRPAAALVLYCSLMAGIAIPRRRRLLPQPP